MPGGYRHYDEQRIWVWQSVMEAGVSNDTMVNATLVQNVEASMYAYVSSLKPAPGIVRQRAQLRTLLKLVKSDDPAVGQIRRTHPARAATANQAGSAEQWNRQFHGSNSPSRDAGWSPILGNTSASQARGSRSFSLAVTMRL